jgi:TRAP-type C4-dicarboxylate transport system permease small subunit
MFDKSIHGYNLPVEHEKKISHKILRIVIYILLILIFIFIPAGLLKLLNDKYNVSSETLGIILTFSFYVICYLGYKYIKK